ncbi:hypothetical protein CIG75_15535 [Tumebacillus algifaecis]|uniref:Uncharacterized protein n=1 Tax=Tumebacillus algifaecis TaxID=1214604 RepID=A0A223D453_9BACL|nr:hypothetical protein [Tumebacillus algifaecis]ASS76213.1 hypothetical protein CIG75_15535 [Tumebacillus algifaecis]
MRFSRAELIEIITPHVLRTLVRLHGAKGDVLTQEELSQAGLSEEQQRALLQTRRLEETEPGVYRVQL